MGGGKSGGGPEEDQGGEQMMREQAERIARAIADLARIAGEEDESGYRLDDREELSALILALLDEPEAE